MRIIKPTHSPEASGVTLISIAIGFPLTSGGFPGGIARQYRRVGVPQFRPHAERQLALVRVSRQGTRPFRQRFELSIKFVTVLLQQSDTPFTENRLVWICGPRKFAIYIFQLSN
jgi:hypothetical protein